MFEFPLSSQVNQVIHKNKIVDHAQPRPTTRIKDLLTAQIHQIRWHAKLAETTLRIPATAQVTEIQIFHLVLKGAEIHPDLLQFLDRTIPHPILFRVVASDGQIAHSAAYKRPSDVGGTSHIVVGERFTSGFLAPPVDGWPLLPSALDLGHLYRALLEPLLPLASRRGEVLGPLIQRCSEYQIVQSRIKQLTNKVNREKQFNRRVEMNRELNELKVTQTALQ